MLLSAIVIGICIAFGFWWNFSTQEMIWWTAGSKVATLIMLPLDWVSMKHLSEKLY